MPAEDPEQIRAAALPHLSAGFRDMAVVGSHAKPDFFVMELDPA